MTQASKAKHADRSSSRQLRELHAHPHRADRRLLRAQLRPESGESARHGVNSFSFFFFFFFFFFSFSSLFLSSSLSLARFWRLATMSARIYLHLARSLSRLAASTMPTHVCLDGATSDLLPQSRHEPSPSRSPPPPLPPPYSPVRSHNRHIRRRLAPSSAVPPRFFKRYLRP